MLLVLNAKNTGGNSGEGGTKNKFEKGITRHLIFPLFPYYCSPNVCLMRFCVGRILVAYLNAFFFFTRVIFLCTFRYIMCFRTALSSLMRTKQIENIALGLN